MIEYPRGMTLDEIYKIRDQLRLYKEWTIMIYGSNAWVWFSKPWRHP